MNCWVLPPSILDVIRTLPLSSRGELELPMAVGLLVAAGRALPRDRCDAPVLDLVAARRHRRRGRGARRPRRAACEHRRRRAARLGRNERRGRWRSTARRSRRRARRVDRHRGTCTGRRVAVRARADRGAREAHRLRGRVDAHVRGRTGPRGRRTRRGAMGSSASSMHGCAHLSSSSVDPAMAVPAGRWSTYPMTAARRLARNFGEPYPGADIAFHSTLPRAAG